LSNVDSLTGNAFGLILIVTVSVVLIIPSVFVAFNLDHDSRVRHKASVRAFWDSCVGGLIDRGSDPTGGSNPTMKKNTPDQEVSGKLTPIDESGTEPGNSRRRWIRVPKKWRINRPARPKQQDAEIGGNIAQMESP
jgi:hypothetical protein